MLHPSPTVLRFSFTLILTVLLTGCARTASLPTATVLAVESSPERPTTTPTAASSATSTTTPSPVVPTPTATNTRIPATSTREATPTRTATMAPTATPTVAGSPTATPTPAPSPTWTPLPLPTVGTGGRVPLMAEPGFSIEVFGNSAEDPIEKPTNLSWGPDGSVYVSQMGGTILRIGEDGTRTRYAEGFDVPLGVAFQPGTDRLYVSHRHGVTRLVDTNGDHVADVREPFLTDMPCCYADLHQTNSIQFGPDGWLYVAQGATSDHGEQPGEPWHAGILRAHPDRGMESLEYVARGVRNPYDLVVSMRVMPGKMFATDNGADYGPPEELNHIVPGEHYGWPFCVTLESGEVAPHPVWDDPERCAGTRAAIATFVPHASANGITMYEADAFPPAYRGNLFVALWSHIPGAYRIVRVQLRPVGDTFAATVTDFVTNFELPLAVAVGPDGALYIADWGPGRLYRVVYQGS